jgi:glycosyltransferase involved in cell wall biosynthesis
MKILFLESFFGGSHMDFALGLKENSKYEIDIISLPARNWKWRMRGAALEFKRLIENIEKYDLIFITDMINLADFKALVNLKDLPVILYFHENQLTYPLSQGQKRDWQFGYTNITSALFATKVFFNSSFQLSEFLGKIDELIKIVPDLKPEWVKDEIEKKSSVLYPGCRFSKALPKLSQIDIKKPLIIWNHRWEWDKKPDDFFWCLQQIKERKIPFELALLGEKTGTTPDIFKRVKKQFSEEIVAFGYIDSKKEYISLLQKGAIVISTAIQENFGISIIEAVRMGCIPLLPDRLSYPEIMPEHCLTKILYSGKKDLVKKLENLLRNYHEYNELREQLSSYMEKYSWETVINNYDMEFEKFMGIKE